MKTKFIAIVASMLVACVASAFAEPRQSRQSRKKDKESSSSSSQSEKKSNDIPCHDKASILADAAKSPEPEKFITDLFSGDYAVSVIQYGTSNRLVLQQKDKMPILMEVPPYQINLQDIKKGETILRGGWESEGLRVNFYDKASGTIKNMSPRKPIYYLTAAELSASKSPAVPAKK